MDDNDQKETINGYEIQRAIVFENNRGFALAENPAAASPYATFMFTEEENGTRDYYWGHYTSNKDAATRDYELRIAEYQKDYGQSERDAYKYYSTQRPVDIGTFPKTGNGPVRIVNFDTREGVEQGRFQAWGYLVYDAPLTEKQINDYELRAAPDNPDVKARMREQAQTVGAWEEKREAMPYNRLTGRIHGEERYYINPHVTPEQIAERYRSAVENPAHPNGKRPRRIAEQLAEGAERAAKNNAARTALLAPKNRNKQER